MKPTMLTTTDNPYDPFTQFDEWNAFDVAMGYHTCSYLARVTVTTEDLGPIIEEQAIDEAMNKIVDTNLTGVYKKVYMNDDKDANKQSLR